MKSKDINFNYSECYKKYEKLGSTTYQNICNGEKSQVPWGIEGWGVFLLILLGIIFLLTVLIILIKELIDLY